MQLHYDADVKGRISYLIDVSKFPLSIKLNNKCKEDPRSY